MRALYISDIFLTKLPPNFGKVSLISDQALNHRKAINIRINECLIVLNFIEYNIYRI